MQQQINKQSILYFFLIVFTIAIYILGLFPETTVDSAKYAAISRSVLDNNDLIHLKIHEEPYMHKPPLLFWLGALSFKIFGLSIFAFKLPTLLFSFLGIYSTYRFGTLIYNKQAGIIAAVLYSTSEAFFLYNMDVHTDLLLATAVIFGTWQLAEYLENQKIINYILGFIGIGLAMITKGPVGLAIPVFSIGGYLLLKRDYKNIFSLKWVGGIAILILILYPGLKGVYDHFGLEGIKFYFWSNNYDRMAGYYTRGRQPDYFFVLHTLLYVFLPWSFFTYSAFVRDWRTWKKESFKISNFKTVYCYAPLLIFGFIISISSQQAPHYLLPLIPFLSILTAKLLDDVTDSEKYPRTYKLLSIFRTVIVIILWPLLLTMIVYFFPTKSIYIWGPVLVLFTILIFSFFLLKSRIQKLIVPLVVSIIALTFVANTVYMPSALKYHGVIQASYLYNKLETDNLPLYTYDYTQFESYFYPKRVSGFVIDDQLNDILLKGSCWLITTEIGFEKINSQPGINIETKYILPYKKLTNISLKFLNPKTRESSLERIYLLKII